MTDPPTPPADWYPDPEVDGRLRYWDGEHWTDHVHGEVAPEPALPTRADLHHRNDTRPALGTPHPAKAGLAFLIAAGFVAGLYLPFVEGGSVTLKLSDDGNYIFTFLVGAALIVFGAVRALADRPDGLPFAVGVAIPIACFAAVLVRVWSRSTFGSTPDVKPGLYVFALTVLITAVAIGPVLVASVASRRVRAPSPLLVPLAVVASVGTSTAVLVPPDGLAVWAHLSGGDGWVGASSVVLIAAPVVATLLFAARRTVPAAALSLGVFVGMLVVLAPPLVNDETNVLASRLDWLFYASIGLGVVVTAIAATGEAAERQGFETA